MASQEKMRYLLFHRIRDTTPAPTNKSSVKAIIDLVVELEDSESKIKDVCDRQALEKKLEAKAQEALKRT